MNKVTSLGVRAGFVAALSILAATTAFSMEKYSPMLPGVSTGVPAGALPPDGLYFSLSFNPQWGTFKDGSGNSETPNGTPPRRKVEDQFGMTPQLLWVPGWEVLGAKYGAMITQPLLHQHSTAEINGTIVDTSSNNAMFNTIVTPLMLSWNLGGGWFVGTGMSFYLKDAPFYHNADGSANAKTFANNYWTFEPNVAISYLGNDWNITLNNTFDFNTTNNLNGYHSGATYYLDMTAAKRFGQWQVGVIGNFIQQFENDTIYGQVVAANPGHWSAGAKIQHVKFGPMVAYTFQNGLTVQAKYLQAVHTENDIGVNQFWLNFSVPLFSGKSFSDRPATKLITK